MPGIRVASLHGFGAGKFWLIALTVGVAAAQVMPPVGYPGGGYPGGYPRNPVGGIPIPSRGKSQPNSSTKGQPLPNFRGKLKQMDSKTITLALDDDRILDFRRTGSTKFFKGGAEIKDPKFNPGDQLSIEGPEDNTGYLTAANVYWEKAAGAEPDTASKDKDRVPDAWAETPATQPKATEAAPPPARTDRDDPGPPTLQRGAAADPSREKAAPLPPIPAEGPPPPKPTTVASAAPPGRIPTVARG